MTGNDHNHDALVAALRQPALRAEQVGETAAVAAMVEAQTQISAASKRPRSRRGVAIAAVTVASLGLGGLAAAGPGIFSPAADRPDTPATTPTSVPATTAGDDEGEQGDDVAPTSSPGDEARDDTDGGTGACAEGDDDATASSVDRDPAAGCETTVGADDTDSAVQIVDDATTDRATTDGDVRPGNSANAPGQTGTTPGQSGATPGQSDVDPPGQAGTSPGQTGNVPGQVGETAGSSGGSAPGRSGPDAPGRSGAAPGHSDDATEQSDDATEQSYDAPGQSDDAPGRSGRNEQP